MNTPICDFVRRYAESNALRLHMPGHKGEGPLGVEALDITEISGADSLYEADGIIRESEENAGRLFGSATFYSTEGSSLCIRAMLYLALLHAKKQGRKPLIAAGRNAHKAFMSAAVLLDLDVCWFAPQNMASYLSCELTAEDVERLLAGMREKPAAVYLTSPDYLGNMADIRGIARVCHNHDVLLLVDNAHGAYLKFLPTSLHPVDLGADMCCDSAHKTLPVLTGGAYLHISPDAPELFVRQAKNALALFGSTSPSYLILQSLDAANRRLAGDYPAQLAQFCAHVYAFKWNLVQMGYSICGNEPMKLTIRAKMRGYTGYELAQLLLDKGIVVEFADPDFLVLMFTPEIGVHGLERLETALEGIAQKDCIHETPPIFHSAQRVMSVREAVLHDCETVAVEHSLGRVLAAASVGCPPAVPIVVCGERIDEHAIHCFKYYGISRCTVVREC